jgi:hypothetical protein
MGSSGCAAVWPGQRSSWKCSPRRSGQELSDYLLVRDQVPETNAEWIKNADREFAIYPSLLRERTGT